MRSIRAGMFICALLLHSPSFGRDHPDGDFWKSQMLDNDDFYREGNRTLKQNASDGRTESGGRVAYGVPASAKQFPFMAALAVIQASSYTYICGATVIAPTYVLTAARCLFEKTTFRPPSHALLGAVDISFFTNFPEQIPVLQAFYPSQYRPGVANSNFDVAVLKLARSTVAPKVLLASYTPPAGASLISIGWGSSQLTSVGGMNYILQYASVQVGTFGVAPCPANCNGQVPCTIQCDVGSQMALGGYASACQGDYGGPQMLSETQVSVISFVSAECGDNKYGYSTLISTVSTYIQEILAGGGTSSPLPSPTQSPILSPAFSPSPMPSSNCTLGFSSGVIVTLTATASSCKSEAADASGMAAGDVSGSKPYCCFAKCIKSSGRTITMKIKLIVANSRITAKLNIVNSFKNGQFYAQFKLRLPIGYQKYQLRTGSACVFPGPNCSY